MISLTSETYTTLRYEYNLATHTVGNGLISMHVFIA